MHTELTSEELLRKCSLKVTPARQRILEVFLNFEYALSYGDLEMGTNGDLDKVTVYRALKSFEEKGIIHQVLDKGGAVKYAICHSDCTSHHHHDTHVHFKCVKCENIYCLEESKIELPPLPSNYSILEYDLLVQGVCARCK